MHFKIWSQLIKPEKIFTWVNPSNNLMQHTGGYLAFYYLASSTVHVCMQPEHRDANCFHTWPPSITARMQNGAANVEDGFAVPYKLNADHRTQQSHSQALTQEK